MWKTQKKAIFLPSWLFSLPFQERLVFSWIAFPSFHIWPKIFLVGLSSLSMLQFSFLVVVVLFLHQRIPEIICLCNILEVLLLHKFFIIFKKNCGIFHISAQNIDCKYLLELPPHRGGSYV